MRTARLERLKAMRLDRESLAAFVKRDRGYTRGRLIAEGLLVEAAPDKGTAMVDAEHRSAEGSALFQQAKDVLYGLLFGDEHCQVRFDRVERELLTLNLPRAKAQALGFMRRQRS